jgi:hypothetical protein
MRMAGARSQIARRIASALDIRAGSCFTCELMRRVVQLGCAVLVLAVGGCASKPTLRISAERSAAVDFSGYHTYRWARPLPEVSMEHPRSGRDLLDWRIRTAIEKQLAIKGYVEATSAKADLLVVYHLEIREKNTDSVADFLDYRQGGGDADMQEAFVFGYQEGTLVIEVLDAASRRLVWRGVAGPLISPDSQQERVRSAVDQVMARFPGH